MKALFRSPLLLLLGLALAALQGCGAAPALACAPGEAAPFVGTVGGITLEWNDALATASASDGSALRGAVDEMKRLREQVDALQPPGCAAPAREALRTYMGTSIDAYDAKIAGQPEAEVDSLLKRAEQQYAAFEQAFTVLQGGLPN
jgi:hypothetical protein